MTREEIYEKYSAEVANIRASNNNHPQLMAMAMNEARRQLDRELANLDMPKKESNEKITQRELYKLFGDLMPIEAMTILVNDKIPLAEVRQKLQDLASAAKTQI